jgi:O-succinylbenzoate synthase
VATLQQLQRCYEQGWRGLMILKPAIAGSPRLLRRFSQQHSLTVIFSSVLETEIGRQAGLRLAAELATPGYAQGFGVGHWFGDDGFNHPVADLEKRWNCL